MRASTLQGLRAAGATDSQGTRSAEVEECTVLSLVRPAASPPPTLRDGEAEQRLRVAGERMWPAWRALQAWEQRASTEFGDTLGRIVLLLWTAHCFGGNEDAVALCLDAVESIDRDSVLADVAEVAFALGAGWAAASRVDSGP